MNELFLRIVNMSITASILVLVVLVLRLAFRKAPKWVSVLLWGFVAIRLICPFTIESEFSLMPNTEWVEEQTPQAAPAIPDAIAPDVISGQYPATESSVSVPPPSEISIEKGISLASFLPYIWLFGIAAMMLYTIVSYLQVYGRIRSAEHLRDNIYTSENIPSPFVFGILRPRICLPAAMEGASMDYVIAHEQAHIRRRDHLWKPLGFILLSIHWFNPLLWLAYILLCRDIEMACDEHVVRDMGDMERADYSQALLDSSVSRRMISACPLAFGEVGVKERIKSVLHYKKPAFWIVVIALAACVIAAVCFLTNPRVMRIDAHKWAFSHIQTSEGIIYTSEERAYLYHSNNLLNLNLKVENEKLNLEQIDTGDMWQFTYNLEDIGRGVTIYTITVGDRSGYAIVAKTKSYDDDMAAGMIIVGAGKKSFSLPIGETTLILAVDDYAVYFYEDTSTSTEVEPMPEIEKLLTLSDVLALSEKGHDLVWDDFEQYTHTDIGSGLFIRLFEIDETFSVKVGGGSTNIVPMYVYLCAKKGENEERIDIRDGGVEEFVILHQKADTALTSFTEQDKTNFSYTPLQNNEEFTDPKTSIYSRMLNAIDYYNSVRIEFYPYMLSEDLRVVCELDLDSGRAYQASYINDELTQEFISDGEVVSELNHKRRYYDSFYTEAYTRKDSEPIALAERVTTASDGLPCYNYRRNVINCPLASYTLFAQELAFSYLADFTRWEIIEKGSYLGRDCVVIEGMNTPYITEKHDADTFRLTIDKQTGIVLMLIGKNGGIEKKMIEVTALDFGIPSVYQGMLTNLDLGGYTMID